MTLPKCRPFLVTPVARDLLETQSLVEAALSAGDVASLLVPSGPRQRETLESVKRIAHRHDVALLAENDVALARDAGADGVQIDADAGLYATARTVLGDDAIVGGNCGRSRHAAMSVAELGADYVAFSDLEDEVPEDSIVAWWAEMFEIPLVVFDAMDAERARGYVRRGADFVRLPDDMWLSEETAARCVAAWNSIIEDSVKC